MSDDQKGDDDKPEANKGTDYVLAGLVFLAATVWGGITGKSTTDNDAGDSTRELAKWTKVVGFWTRGLVVVAVITAVVLLGQLCILYKTDQTSRATNRAFVYFETVSFTPYPFKGTPALVAIETIIINSGNTPAYRVAIKFDCPDKTGVGSNADPFDSAKLESKYDPPTFLGPKQRVPLLVCELKPEFGVDTVKGDNAWYVVAEVKYADAFDPTETRITQMTRNIRVDQFGGGSFGYVGKHNCADRDCPK